MDSDDFVMWSEPSPKPAPGTGTIVADNDSDRRQDLSIGGWSHGPAHSAEVL
ncbi:uncharacterized protein PHACADRAFT_252730, partial [Phanerochaete carnosa HHB-10118-sp]